MATSTVKRAEGSRSPSRNPGPVVRRRPRQRSDDPTPVVSGRFNVGLLMVCAMVFIPFSPIGKWIEGSRPTGHNPSSWTAGTEGQLRVTIVTGDYDQLTCASPTAVAGKHCAYKSKTEAWPPAPGQPVDDNKAELIQPYRTSPDNKLVLIVGLWSNPTIAMRLHREPPHSSDAPNKKHIRFTADCKVKFIGRIDDAILRWTYAGDWVNEGGSIVAQPISCRIGGED
jgi:hypothetical protein